MLLGGSTSVSEINPETTAGQSQTRLNEELNRFLNLLITQLKNQDPLDPMDSNEFTSQLVQFASVEQQIYQNANLEKLLNIHQTSQVASMVDFIGMTVEAKGSELQLDNSKGKFTYELDVKANEVTISIRNASGLTVFTTDGENDSGKHTFEWDGKDSSGNQMNDGPYTVIVSPQDRGGNLQNVAMTTFGRVTGAGAEDGKISLFMGEIIVLMDDVLAVEETEKEPIL